MEIFYKVVYCPIMELEIMSKIPIWWLEKWMALDGFKNGLFCIDKNCSNNDMLGKFTFPSGIIGEFLFKHLIPPNVGFQAGPWIM